MSRSLESRQDIALVGAAAAGAVLLAVVGAGSPVRVLVAVAAMGVIAVCAVRVDLAVLVLLATAPIENFVSISPNPQITITKLAGALAFAAFLAGAILNRRQLLFDRSHVVLLLLLAVAAVSTVEARTLGPAVVNASRYASFVALYIVLSQFVGDHRLLVRAAWALSLSSTVAAFIGMQNFFSGRSPQATPTYGNQGELAFFLATTLPLAVWLLARSRWSSRLVLVPMVGVMSAGLLLTFNRSALLGLAVGIAWHAVTERRHIPVLVGGAVVAVVFAGIFVHSNPRTVTNGLAGKRHVAGFNVEIRLQAWSAAADLAAAHPFIGVGPGNFSTYFFDATDRPSGTYNVLVVHDAYLDVAAELGLLGAVLFLAYLALAFARLRTAVHRRVGPPGLASAVRTSLIVTTVAALTLSEQYFAPFWVFGAMATLLWREAAPTSGAAPPPAG